MEHAAHLFKIFREKGGFNQEAIAEYLGIKREMVSYYETGAREIPLEVLEKLADLFGVDLEVFFSEKLEDVAIDISFAFRANNMSSKDLEGIAAFRKIVKNYQRIINLEKSNA